MREAVETWPLRLFAADLEVGVIMTIFNEEKCAFPVGTRVRLHSGLYDVAHNHLSGGGYSSVKRYDEPFAGTITENNSWCYKVKPDKEEYWTLSCVFPHHIVNVI